MAGPLAPELAARHQAQLSVDEREELIEGRPVAAVQALQQLCDFVGLLRHKNFARVCARKKSLGRWQ